MTLMPCVQTLRDFTSAAVSEDTREMANFVLVRNVDPYTTKFLLCHAIFILG